MLLLIAQKAVYGQRHRLQAPSIFEPIIGLDSAQIKKGQQLHQAQTKQFADFLLDYIEHGKEQKSISFTFSVYEELYKDETYTYIARICKRGTVLAFIKVSNRTLDQIDWKKIDGNVIRQSFEEQIIPKADKEKVKRRQFHCGGEVDHSVFSYQYLAATQEVAITYHWKLTCDFMYNLINKTYVAHYDLKTHQLTNKGRKK